MRRTADAEDAVAKRVPGIVFSALRFCTRLGLPRRVTNAIPSIIIFLPFILATPSGLNWSQVSDAGFNEHAPPYPGQETFDVAVFRDQLYLGMEGRMCARIWRSRAGVSAPASQADWEQVVSNGFDGMTDCAIEPPTTENDHIDSIEAFGPYLYASTAMKDGSKHGSQVWRSPTGDPGTWVLVNQPGFGQHTNENFKDMIESAGLLCGGTISFGEDGITSGAQVWCTDGMTSDPDQPGALLWTQRNRNGFGHVENVRIWTSGVLAGALYFGVEAQGANGSIWRTRNIDNADAWEQVFTPAEFWPDVQVSRVDVLQTFDGALYVGMAVPGHGAHVYRSTTGDPGTWQPVVTDGFGSATSDRFISDASTVLGDALYVAVLDNVKGVSVWRTPDGTSWSRVSAYGFGDPPNFWAELIAYNNLIYAWTANYSTGPQVWRAQPGP